MRQFLLRRPALHDEQPLHKGRRVKTPDAIYRLCRKNHKPPIAHDARGFTRGLPGLLWRLRAENAHLLLPSEILLFRAFAQTIFHNRRHHICRRRPSRP